MTIAGFLACWSRARASHGGGIRHDVGVRDKREAVPVNWNFFTRNRSNRWHGDRGDCASCRNVEEPATRNGNYVNRHKLVLININ